MSLELTLDAERTNETGSTPWGAVTCLSLLSFLLVGLEFLPVSLLTPIAGELGVTEGRAGLAIAVSGFFAVATSLFGNTLLGRLDRKPVVLFYTATLAVSSAIVALAPNFLVFLAGRALVGVAIGGFWSLSTAILARLAAGPDLPKAIAVLQGGTALAIVIAAPVGSYLGGMIGWRGTFLVTVPIGLAALIWQWALGMAGTALVFIGMNALSIYLRPFLEGVAGLGLNHLSLALLGLGIGGLAGTSVISFALKHSLTATLVGLPIVLAIIAVALIGLGPFATAAVTLLVLWGFFSTPVPVAWGTWMARVIPDDLEAAGGLQVALIQLAIAGGAFLGGLLFDGLGWWSAFLFAAGLLLASALFALSAGSRPVSGQ